MFAGERRLRLDWGYAFRLRTLCFFTVPMGWCRCVVGTNTRPQMHSFTPNDESVGKLP